MLVEEAAATAMFILLAFVIVWNCAWTYLTIAAIVRKRKRKPN